MIKSYLRNKIKIFQIILFGVFIIGSLVFLIYPFLPAIEYYINPPEVEYISQSEFSKIKKQIPDENYLIIPKIGVRMPIVEGENEDEALDSGAWHLPGTSTPVLMGNMVLAAHRFKYKPPHERTFYLLDKIKEGDLLQVFWEGRGYLYKVASSEIVEPDKTEVLEETPEPTLTLITCHPLFSDKKRLIVRGELIERK